MRRLLLVMLLAAAVTLALFFRDRLSVVALDEWLRQAGLLAPLLFVLCYALATVLFLPGVLFTLAGGALFGPVLGTLYNLCGATIGATLAFLLARYLAGDWVTRHTGGRLRRLVDGVEREGWRFVAFVRLVPLFPFNLLNYALGLTRINLIQYVVATFICMAPAGAAYTWLGYVGREAVTGGEDLVRKALLALALLATVLFVSRLVLRRHGTDA